MSSLGHELGIMFGFMAACLVVLAVYTVLWKGILPFTIRLYTCLMAATAAQRKSASDDLDRRKALQNKPPLRDRRTAVHEKMLDRYALPFDLAELPASSGWRSAEPRAPRSPAGLGVAFDRTVSPFADSIGGRSGANLREAL